MILSSHQPVYLPSLHLFNKISLSDKFVFLGHCQFVNQSWHSRNMIRNGDHPLTLTVPVVKAGHFGQSITDAAISGSHWKRKHLGSIRNAYQKRPYFKDYFPALEELINRPWTHLGEMNVALILQFLEWLEIETPIFYSEEHAISGHKTDMLMSSCQAMTADCYLSNEGSRCYVDEKKMCDAEISHYWQDFTHPVYDQGMEFIANLSIIDCLFNMGPASRELVVNAGVIKAGEYTR